MPPISYAHKRYFPILKTKAGERWAIDHLPAATKTRLTPVFEIHAHKTKSHDEHVAVLCDDLLSAWGNDRLFYLDTVWLHPSAGSATVITSVFELARKCGLKAIPVARLSYSTATRQAIQKIVAKDKLGYMLRLDSDEFSDATRIESLVNAIAGRDVADLMLDYQSSGMDLPTDLPMIQHIKVWRRLIAAAGSFPKSFTGYAQGRWHRIRRDDFGSWEDGITKHKLVRKPAFADFTVRDPGAPAEFGAPSVNLRYARNNVWLFRIGGKVNAGHSAQMHAVCADLVGRPQFSGSVFSSGDTAIWDTASGLSGPGNSPQWVQWSVNHHLEFTVQQIAAHPSI